MDGQGKAGWRIARVWSVAAGASMGLAHALHVVGAAELGLGTVGIAAMSLSPVVLGGALGGLIHRLAEGAPSVAPRSLGDALLLGAWPMFALMTFRLDHLGSSVVLGLLPAGLLALRRAFATRRVLAAILAATPFVLAVGFASLTWDAARHGRRPTVDHPSVLLVTVEDLDPARLGAHRTDTPALDALAQSGTIVTGAAPAAQTPDEAIAAFLDRDPQRPLLQTLSDGGWPVGAFLDGQAPDTWVGLDALDVVDDAADWPLGWRRVLPWRWFLGAPATDRRGGDTVERALRWIRGRDDAHVAWVHLGDPAFPWTPPPPFDARYLPPTVLPAATCTVEGRAVPRDEVAAAYDGEVAYVDAQIGRLLDEIDGSGRGGETLVVVAGVTSVVVEDGGEPCAGGHRTVDQQAVPIVLRLPARLPVDHRVGARLPAEHLADTILDLVGLEHEASWLDEVRRRDVSGPTP